MDGLKERYFQWLYDLVKDEEHRNYSRLLRYLHETDFDYIVPRDRNRARDGIDLRSHFAKEQGIGCCDIFLALDGRVCSVLEMMVALSRRCEDSIMNDPDIGDRAPQWFWIMIANLGLWPFSDAFFDEDKVREILRKFIRREYEANGEGGLFTLQRRDTDLRGVEIWYQAMWYLSEILKR